MRKKRDNKGRDKISLRDNLKEIEENRRNEIAETENLSTSWKKKKTCIRSIHKIY